MSARHTTSVAIIGAGASGTLAAIQLLHRSKRAALPLEIRLIDPSPTTGRGIAYGTDDPRHLLNVPSSRMSAVAGDPEHFCRWLAATKSCHDASAFVSRAWFGEYLASSLREAEHASCSRVERVYRTVTEIHRRTNDTTIRLDDGSRFRASHVITALGSPGGPNQLLPATLLRSNHFVSDPWAPGVLDVVADEPGDVVILGTGLTTVDVAIRVARPGRTITALSRRGLLPRPHAHVGVPCLPAPPLPPGRLSLTKAEELVTNHLRSSMAKGASWQAAFDSLRPVTNDLWSRLGPLDQQDFVAGPMRSWEVARHRMAPHVATSFNALLTSGALVADTGEVVGATDLSDGIELHLADGSRRRATTVISCTGATSVRGSTGPLGDLVRNLEHQGVVALHPLGLGLITDDTGRATGSGGEVNPPVYVIGPLRRGGLWETTAVPEILLQAAQVASSIVDSAPRPLPHTRPVDLYDQELSTSGAAADLYNEALGRLLRVQSGAYEALARSVEVDPTFALGHAALGVLGHEFDLDLDVRHHLALAHEQRHRITPREQQFLSAIERRVHGDSSGLIEHIEEHPRDVLAISVAMPTIAFSGAYDVSADAWALLERVAPSYVEDWWIDGLLAFARQEQGHLGEAWELATRALSIEPRSGTAAHALTHVDFEGGTHAEGLAWLDPWVTNAGRDATHLAHFSWHAALHELALNNTEAVLSRFRSQLAPPVVHGTRSMVDSASLLWRLLLEDEIVLPEATLLAESAGAELTEPSTPFSALHAVVTLAVLGDLTQLQQLERRSRSSDTLPIAVLIAPLATAFRLFLEGSFDDAATVLMSLLPNLGPLGGSAAQRSIVEDTAIASLIRAGDGAQAVTLLERRLDRRARPKDLVLRQRAHLEASFAHD